MSLDGLYDDNNVFAKILRGEMPSVKVFEDEDTLAIMDVFPQSEGHVLVIHKREKARNLLDVSQEGLSQVTHTVQKIAKAVNGALAPDGIIITQYNGAPAGQTVFHLHVHIIPRYESSKVQNHASGGMADIGELTKTAEKIGAAL